MLERHLRRLREALGAVTAQHDGWPWEAYEDRLREMRMSNHQLSFLQRRQLRLRRRTQHEVPWRRQLVRIHAAVQRRPGIAHDAAMHLRAKLLRTEQHQAEIPATLRDVE